MKRDKGFTRIPNAILDEPSLTPAAKIVWLLVASYRDGCTLSTRDIAARLHVDRGVVLDALAALVSAGLLTWDKGVGSRRSFLTVCNGRENQPLNNSQWLEKPTNNGREKQPIPPIIYIKKNNKKNNIKRPARAYAYEELAGEKSWEEGLCCSRGIDLETMHAYIADFCRYCHEAEITHRDLSDAKRHFVRQLTSQIERNARQQQTAARGTLGSAGRAQREAAIIAAIAATASEGADTGDDLFDPCGLR